MTAEKSMETNGQAQDQGMAKTAGRKPARRKSRGGASAKRNKTAASRRSGASRSQSKSSGASARGAGRSKSSSASARSGSRRSSSASSASSSRRSRSGKSGSSSSSSRGGIASRLLSTSRKAAGTAYEWAAEGASRAIPLASRGMPDQRMVQRLADERPYMLGALGLGIGAMIGLMLPSPLYMRGGFASRSGGRNRR
ncbi:hypothetical protein [Aestuariivirga sp.]|uniref:hypothetical protein n=1 Tax=Aestuariivirga sp. TaxID=2650926 RepID=UPI003919827B